MLNVDVIEINKKIATFMGYKYYPHYSPEITDVYQAGWKLDPRAHMFSKFNDMIHLPVKSYLCRSHRGLLYHSDFNWLMEVVIKIESLDLSEYFYQWEELDGETEYNFFRIDVDISRNTCYISAELSLDPPYLINRLTFGPKYEKKIDAVYMAVSEFIDWYNMLIDGTMRE